MRCETGFLRLMLLAISISAGSALAGGDGSSSGNAECDDDVLLKIKQSHPRNDAMNYRPANYYRLVTSHDDKVCRGVLKLLNEPGTYKALPIEKNPAPKGWMDRPIDGVSWLLSNSGIRPPAWPELAAGRKVPMTIDNEQRYYNDGRMKWYFDSKTEVNIDADPAMEVMYRSCGRRSGYISCEYVVMNCSYTECPERYQIHRKDCPKCQDEYDFSVHLLGRRGREDENRLFTEADAEWTESYYPVRKGGISIVNIPIDVDGKSYLLKIDKIESPPLEIHIHRFEKQSPGPICIISSAIYEGLSCGEKRGRSELPLRS